MKLSLSLLHPVQSFEEVAKGQRSGEKRAVKSLKRPWIDDVTIHRSNPFLTFLSPSSLVLLPERVRNIQFFARPRVGLF
jgi:hypothetical protein